MKRTRVPPHVSWLVLLALGAAVACTSTEATAQEETPPPEVELVEVASGLEAPTTITHADDGSGRLFILEQPGRIRIVDGGQLLQTPFLDISGSISSGGEQGLLGLTFHPDFPETNAFFVNYTDEEGDTVVARYRVSESDPDQADPDSHTQLLGVEQPYENHNGGGLAFGPDGYLYISLGDGGAGGDPHDNGQNTQTLLGTILRIDVDAGGGQAYAIPGDNPFADGQEGLPEIWAYGLRNPWRFSFDRRTGDMWIADVGQNQWEEVNLEPADAGGGVNYGWNVMEGAHCFEPQEGCDTEGLQLPVLEYDHDQGCSVTGGFVYRGESLPGLQGNYVFGDYCSGVIWHAEPDEGGGWTSRELLHSGLDISAFGEDENGELYVADHGSGGVYRIEPVP